MEASGGKDTSEQGVQLSATVKAHVRARKTVLPSRLYSHHPAVATLTAQTRALVKTREGVLGVTALAHAAPLRTKAERETAAARPSPPAAAGHTKPNHMDRAEPEIVRAVQAAQGAAAAAALVQQDPEPADRARAADRHWATPTTRSRSTRTSAGV